MKIRNAKIVGDQAKWYLEGELSNTNCAEILVGGTGQIVDSEGKNLSETFENVTYKINPYNIEDDAMTVNENGMVSVLKANTQDAYAYVEIKIGEEPWQKYSLTVFAVNNFYNDDSSNPTPQEPADKAEQDGLGQSGDEENADVNGNVGEVETTEKQGNNAVEQANNSNTNTSKIEISNRTLDDEPSTGTNSTLEIVVGCLATLSLVIAVVARKE